MSMGIQSFDNLHDNRVLRYCTDFEAHTLHMDTRTEAARERIRSLYRPAGPLV